MNEELKKRARRAYEWGRFKFALRSAWPLALLFLGTASVYSLSQDILIFGSLSLLAHVALVFWHDEFLPGSYLGVVLGLFQLLAAVFMFNIGMRFISQWCQEMCFFIVFCGSLLVGCLYARKASSLRTRALLRMTGAMLSIGAMMAVVGCLPSNTGLLWGTVFGLMSGGVPTLVWARV